MKQRNIDFNKKKDGAVWKVWNPDTLRYEYFRKDECEPEPIKIEEGDTWFAPDKDGDLTQYEWYGGEKRETAWSRGKSYRR